VIFVSFHKRKIGRNYTYCCSSCKRFREITGTLCIFNFKHLPLVDTSTFEVTDVEVARKC